jgi:hypothetical protein
MERSGDLPDGSKLKQELSSCVERFRKRGGLPKLIVFRQKGPDCEEYWTGDNFEELSEKMDGDFGGEGRGKSGIIIFEMFQKLDEGGKVEEFGYRTGKSYNGGVDMKLPIPIRADILQR